MPFSTSLKLKKSKKSKRVRMTKRRRRRMQQQVTLIRRIGQIRSWFSGSEMHYKLHMMLPWHMTGQ